MKKRGVLIFLTLFLIIGGFTVYFIYGQQIFADIAGTQPYIIFKKATFDYVYPDTEPSPNEIVGKEGISTFAAKGEIEPITFSIRSSIDLGKVDVSITDLSNGKEKIPKENIEIFNIKSWDQCQNENTCDTNPATKKVPELLVKDSEQDLIADERGWVKNDDAWSYYPPKLNKEFNNAIKANETHTFYIKIRTPEKISPGKYRGTINLTPKRSNSKKIALNLEVLPFVLPESKKDFLIYFQHWTTNDFSRDMYSKYLDLFREAGIHGIVNYQGQRSVDEEKWTIEKLKEKGFRGPILTMAWEEVDKLKDHYESNGFEIFFTGYGEPYDQERMKEHLKRSNSIHNRDGKVFAAITKECYDAISDPDFELYKTTGIDPVENTDLPLYGATLESFDWCQNSGQESIPKRSFSDYLKGLWSGEIDKDNPREYYYNQLWTEKEHFNRTAFGFSLWSSKLDGVVPYGVQRNYRPFHGNKQYDDFDSKRKNWNSVYPSVDSPVPTLQWESFREGIDDTRYLTLLEEKLVEAEKKGLPIATTIRSKLKSELSNYLYFDKPWEKISDSKNQNTRKWIADEIETLISNNQEDTQQVQDYITLKPGYNTFTSTDIRAQLLEADPDIIAIRFNQDGNKTWNTIDKYNNKYLIYPKAGYYLYSKKTSDTQIAINKLPISLNTRIYKGWNLLVNFSESSKKLSDFKYKLNDKEVSLSELIKDKTGYTTIYVVKDETARTAEEAFEEIKVSPNNPDSAIPPKATFWFYIF